jgi:hypothetical protein
VGKPDADHVYGGVPPVAVRVCDGYTIFTVPFCKLDVVIERLDTTEDVFQLTDTVPVSVMRYATTQPGPPVSVPFMFKAKL